MAEIEEIHSGPEVDAFAVRGICSWYANGFNKVLTADTNKKQISLMFFATIIVEIIPFLAFFLLDQPHDCFICLGKDPDRVYSSLQFTK